MTDSNHERKQRFASATASRQVSFGGILTAVILLLMFLVRISPTADFVFYTLMSTAVCVGVIEGKAPAGLLIWLTASLLGVVLIGLPYVWQFMLFFGPWALVKALIEGRFPAQRKAGFFIGLLLKVVGFAVLLTAVYFLFRSFVTPSLEKWMALLPYPGLLIPLSVLIVCLLYDWALSRLLTIYGTRIRPHIRYLYKESPEVPAGDDRTSDEEQADR
jgi:hypothetical protein